MFATRFLDLPPLAHAGGSITLPGSKSISNRVLLLAALCEGVTDIHDLLDSDDTRVMLIALKALGCVIQREGNSLRLTGLNGHLPQAPIALFLGNAGTAMRPLTAALSVLGGDFTLSGVPRMHERPIGDLVDALRQLGCRIDYTGQQGFPPLHIGVGYASDFFTRNRVCRHKSRQFVAQRKRCGLHHIALGGAHVHQQPMR